jgi:hypothetical protein
MNLVFILAIKGPLWILVNAFPNRQPPAFTFLEHVERMIVELVLTPTGISAGIAA